MAAIQATVATRSEQNRTLEHLPEDLERYFELAKEGNRASGIRPSTCSLVYFDLP